MARARSFFVLVSLLTACGSSAETAPPEPAPATEAPPPEATPEATEVPTTPTATTITSSVVSRAPIAATGCPATDPNAIAQVGTVHSGSITSPETLDLAGSPHRFPDGVAVENTTLAIEPCALVLVGPNQALWLNGGATLLANGNAEHPITFDSTDAAATRGSWGGLYFNEGSTPRSSLAFVTVEDAGANVGYGEQGAIYAMGNAPIAMNEVTIRRSGGHGISLRGTTRFAPNSAGVHVIDSGNAEIGAGLVAFSDSNVVSTLPTLTQEGCDAPEVVLVGDQNATVSTTQTWRNPGAGIRYHLRTDLSVEGPAGPVLTIAPGVTLAFDAGHSFFVGWSADGGLTMDGQADATRITLTSGRSVQSPGDWGGLLFGEHALSSVCRVAWVTLAFAGAESGWGNPHGCGQVGSAHAAIQLREHPIAAIEHLTVASLGENTTAIQRGFVSDSPPDYTAAALGNDLSAGNCAQSFVEPTTGCPDPVPPCAR